MNKVLLSFFVFVLLGAIWIVRSMGWIIYIGYLLGVGIVHTGISIKRGWLILLGLLVMILSLFIPFYYYLLLV
ncbi:hypothetical protein ACQ0QQ_05035 [Lysinibacillus sphaericus]